MINDDKQIHIIDTSEQVLATFTLQEREKAFSYAEKLEEIGIEVSIKEPSVAETLIHALGADKNDKELLKQEIAHEVDDHIDKCCR